MSRKPRDFLRHILDETEYLILTSKNLSKDSFLEIETAQELGRDIPTPKGRLLYA